MTPLIKKLAAVGLAVGSFSPLALATLIVNGTPEGTFDRNATMVYTSDPTDPTTVTQAQPELGFQATGSLTVNSGTLNITGTQYGSFIGRDGGGVGTLTVNGGTTNWTAAPGDPLFAIANNQATGTISVTGGNLNITAGNFLIGREGGTGNINLTGGNFTLNATNFELNGATGILTFGAGSGLFTLASSGTSLNLGGGISDTSHYINFLSQSAGKLSINGYTKGQFDSLVSAGNIRLNGLQAAPSDFVFAQNGAQGVYSVAPEPASLALLAAGSSLLFFRGRRRHVARHSLR